MLQDLFSGPELPPELGLIQRQLKSEIVGVHAGSAAYPLGGGDPQTVLLRVEAAGSAHLGVEVDVLLVLRLLAVAPLVFPVEVEEAARQDEVAARVGRPATRKTRLMIKLKEREILIV